MPIRVKCKCGKQFAAPDKYAGRKVKCPACTVPLMIPDSASQGTGAAVGQTTAQKVGVKCKCGKTFAAKPELAGKTVRCPGCKEPIKIPSGKAGSKPKPKAEPTARVAATPATDDLFDELGIGSSEGGAGKKCPECRTTMSNDAIICIECGYNENLGKRMLVKRPVTQDDRNRKSNKPDPVKQQKKKGWFRRT